MSQSVEGYILPVIIDPERICYRVSVPNEPAHIAAFMGQLAELGYWYNWERDSAHHGREVAAVWRDVFDQVSQDKRRGRFSIGDCTFEQRDQGAEIEDFMPLRIDCDCNVFVTCCDGTEKQILTSEQVNAAINGPNVPGAPQPPTGGCQQYTFQINGAQTVLIPTAVSTGDTIEIMSDSGASNVDGTLNWKCADGLEYFAGACVGFGAPLGTNYVPAANSGKVILLLNGSYYDITVGTPFTVPGGITLAPPQLLLNYTPGQSISGQINGIVKVCNNQPTAWSHTFDFRLSMHGFSLTTLGGGLPGAWSPGVGVVDTEWNFAACYARGFEVNLLGIPAFELDSMTIDIDFASGVDVCNNRSQYVAARHAAAGYGVYVNNAGAGVVNGAPISLGGPLALSAINELRCQLICSSSNPIGTTTGSCVLRGLTITGHGTEPTWL